MSNVNDNPERDELGFGKAVEDAVGLNLITKFELFGVSLVREPINPACRIIRDDKNDC